MSVDFNYPQNLMQYNESIIAKQSQYEFFYSFPEIDQKMHTYRVFVNDSILDSSKYDVIFVENKGLSIVLKTACRKDDVVHLNIFMPLTRFNEYSICIAADLEIPCAANLSTYTLDYPTYSEKTDKLQIIHSRLGFIEKSKYTIIGSKIRFNNIKFLATDKLYVKVIQDGGILLQ